MRFVHVPKTGGIAVETFLKDKPMFKLFPDGHHVTVCHAREPSLIVIRDPVDRFVSQYNFWKHGSDFAACKNAVDNGFTIRDYIEFIKNGDTEKLNRTFSGEIHYAPQTKWISPNTYRNTIVIVYDAEKLAQKVYDVLDSLGCPYEKNFPVKNVTVRKDPIVLEPEDLEWIKNHYATDFELWRLLHECPEKFRAVH
jgi:hypothetical protein